MAHGPNILISALNDLDWQTDDLRGAGWGWMATSEIWKDTVAFSRQGKAVSVEMEVQHALTEGALPILGFQTKI